MTLRDTFHEYGDDPTAFMEIPTHHLDLYLTHISAYRQFRNYTACEMFETIDALYWGHGYRTMREMDHYIEQEERLVEREKMLLRSFLTGNNDAFNYITRLIFMDKYDFTEPQSI